MWGGDLDEVPYHKAEAAIRVDHPMVHQEVIGILDEAVFTYQIHIEIREVPMKKFQ